MASLINGYEYDIFISYRQKDNKGDHWVSEFVEALKTELESTFKEEICVYFDINPHDGLLETHDVDASLKEKLKCLIFIPIISRTYCDPNSFAWDHEFRAFIEMASSDRFGLKVKIPGGNIISRVLPVQIHDLDTADKKLIEKELGGFMRGIEFIFRSPGINRPLLQKEANPQDNLNRTNYRDQINKVANAIKEIITGLKCTGLVSGTFQSGEPGNKATFTPDRNEKAKRSKRFIQAAVAFLFMVVAASFLYFRMHKDKDALSSLTFPVTVINEFGQKETHRVVRNEFMTRLAIFPFNNESNDSALKWLEQGIYDAILEDLNQFNYISIRGNEEDSLLSLQISTAESDNSPHFLTGSFRMTGDVYSVTSRLYQTSNGAVLRERVFTGKDFFSLIDSISLYARIDLGVKKGILEAFPDLPAKDNITDNLNAFRHYINGYYKVDYKELGSAIGQDSSFALALLSKARLCFHFQASEISAGRSIEQAMRHRKRLSDYNEIRTRIFSLLINGEKEKAVALAELQYKLRPDDFKSLLMLENTYERNSMYDKAVKACSQLNKLVPDNPDYKFSLSVNYRNCAQFDKSLDIAQKIINEDPGKINALVFMGVTNLLNNKPEVARNIFNEAMLMKPEEKSVLSRMNNHISYIQKNSINNVFLEQFTGRYKSENSEINLLISILNDHLFARAENQNGAIFLFPVSENIFVSPIEFNYPNRLDSVIHTFVRDKKGKIIKLILKQGFDAPGEFWKEDSLIARAKDLLRNGSNAESLNEFRKAYELNPEHFYLANFIKHLEFIQGQKYESLNSAFLNCTGRYGDAAIFTENHQLFYSNDNGLIFTLLPLSEQQFMDPSHYNLLVNVVRENSGISGLKLNYKDGREIFNHRIE